MHYTDIVDPQPEVETCPVWTERARVYREQADTLCRAFAFDGHQGRNDEAVERTREAAYLLREEAALCDVRAVLDPLNYEEVEESDFDRYGLWPGEFVVRRNGVLQVNPIHAKRAEHTAAISTVLDGYCGDAESFEEGYTVAGPVIVTDFNPNR